MKTRKLISALMVVSGTLLSSCLLLEPSPLYPAREHFYEDSEESSYYAEAPVLDDTYCRECPCEYYERVPYNINSVCWCGHSRQSHSSQSPSSQDPVSPLTVSDGRGFAVFVPAENLIAAYKEAVELDPNKGNPYAIQKNEVYSNVLYLPAAGGSYEFEYTNETFYVASIYDSSIPRVRSPFSTFLFKTVNSLSYSGPYYRISCNRGTHTWKIVVEPMAQSVEPETRSIYVLIWTSSHNYNFVFHFEQSIYDNFLL